MKKNIKYLILSLLLNFRCAPEKVDFNIKNFSSEEIYFLKKTDVNYLMDNNFILHDNEFKSKKIHKKIYLPNFKYDLDFYLSNDKKSYIFYFASIKETKNDDVEVYDILDSISVPKENIKIGDEINEIIYYSKDRIEFKN